MNEVLKAIADRRSIRSYSQVPVTDEQLEALVQAAVQSPSAVNRQPYHFTFVRDPEILKEFTDDFYSIMDPAETKGEYFNVIRGATLVCFIFSEIPGVFTPVDSGIAVENMALAAHSMGLGSVILGMPRQLFMTPLRDKWMKILNAPQGGEYMIAIGIGNPLASKDAHPVREGLVTILK